MGRKICFYAMRCGFVFALSLLLGFYLNTDFDFVLSPAFAAQRSDVYVATNRFQSPSTTDASSSCIGVDSDKWYEDTDCSGTKNGSEAYLSDAAAAETNSLETTITGIADTEIFVGNGADSGTFVVLSGEATLANTGAITLDNDALDDQYYDSESDLTTLLDDNYLSLTGGSLSGGVSSSADATFTDVTVSNLTGSKCVETDANGKLVSAADVCGSGGSGDSVTVNSSAIDTTADFLDNAEITWSIVDGGAGGPDNITANIINVSGTDATFTTVNATHIGNVTAGDATFNEVTCVNCIQLSDIADSAQYDTKCIYFEDPTADDDFNSIWANKTAQNFTITEIWAESDQTVNFDLQVDDGTPADVNGTDISPAAGEAEDTSLGGDTQVATGEELDLAITSVSGTPTWVSICFTGYYED